MTWRDHIKVHPAADLFPMMPDDELKAMGEDIKKGGLKYPLAVWSPTVEAYKNGEPRRSSWTVAIGSLPCTRSASTSI
jgi:hypothetical protein